MKSIVTDPRVHGDIGDERIRTADRGGTNDGFTTCVSPAQERFSRGYVYFLQEAFNEQGAIKVGFSRDPQARCAYINRRLKHPSLTILAVFPATFDVERELHQRWAEHRVIGEWFRPAAAILEAAALCRLLHPTVKEAA